MERTRLVQERDISSCKRRVSILWSFLFLPDSMHDISPSMPTCTSWKWCLISPFSEALTTTWTKYYCLYQKENKILTMIPYNQVTAKGVSGVSIKPARSDACLVGFSFSLFNGRRSHNVFMWLTSHPWLAGTSSEPLLRFKINIDLQNCVHYGSMLIVQLREISMIHN